jgi:hypothetical protein
MLNLLQERFCDCFVLFCGVVLDYQCLVLVVLQACLLRWIKLLNNACN